MPILLCIIESYFLYNLYKKYGFEDCAMMIYTIVYFYCNAILFDIYIFGNESILSRPFVYIDMQNEAFDMVFISYFLFLFSFYILFYYNVFSKDISNKHINHNKFNVKINTTLIIAISAYLLITAFYNLQVERVDLKGGESFFTTTLHVLIVYFFVLIIFYSKGINRTVFYIFLVSFILYCIARFERETLVLLALVFLYRFKPKLNIIFVIFLGIIGIYTLAYYKAFSGIVLRSGDWFSFVNYVENNPISLASLDPLPSFTILYDYFYSKAGVLYTDFQLTYIYSFIDQFERYYYDKEVLSLGQFLSQTYVSGEYGVASSMILESILNFSFLGPILLALFTRFIYFFTKNKFSYISKVIDIMFIMFFLSFVRTELMVMIKTMILPISIFLILISIYVKINFDKNENGNSKDNNLLS